MSSWPHNLFRKHAAVSDAIESIDARITRKEGEVEWSARKEKGEI